MAKKERSDVPLERLEAYDKAIATIPDLQRKGAKNPYTSLNGHMFSFFNKEYQLSLRFSEEEKEAFITSHEGSGPSISYGAVMRGYALIPDDILFDEKALAKYMKQSYNYIASLKPKPTKKPKK